MINNNVGINIVHITTKANEIADRISCAKTETDILPNFEKLVQDFSTVDILSSFSPKSRARLLNYSNNVAKEVIRSSGSKRQHTS